VSTKTQFLETTGEYFHVYNRGVSRTRIFLDNRNYEYFLERMEKYLDPAVPIVAYCLMPNHFHFLLRQDNQRALSNYLGLVCKSYVKALNKSLGRSGQESWEIRSRVLGDQVTSLKENTNSRISMKRDIYSICRDISISTPSELIW
jgi:REP element-mobilizing transposase RayT